MPNTLTCVYCGVIFPKDTPLDESQIMSTIHIKHCRKHPMRKAEETISKLKAALSGLVGASTKEELEMMEAVIRSVPAPDADRAATINAIHALLDVAND